MNIPSPIIDWNPIEKTEHEIETGVSFWQILHFNG